jgi:hypothetical protein
MNADELRKVRMVWYSMIRRCTNPNSSNYSYYGGRGISVCDRWAASFNDFISDMGDRPEGGTLDSAKDKNKTEKVLYYI